MDLEADYADVGEDETAEHEVGLKRRESTGTGETEPVGTDARWPNWSRWCSH